MGNASNVQTEFLSGEWSPYAQGRLDDPEYKRGMNVCRNVWPIETGAATRRVGTRFLDFTRNGQMGRMIAFSFSQNAPYTMEFTDGKLRFRDSQGIVKSEEPRLVQYINQALPAEMIVSNPCSDTPWAAGDEVMFHFPAGGASVASGALVTRQFTLATGSDDEHWYLYDAVTGAPLDGSTVLWDNSLTIQVARIFELDTPYVNGSWAQLRGVQDESSVLLLHPSIQSQSVFAPIDGGNLFTITPVQFIDGPYLDPPQDGSFLIPSGQSGVITLQLQYNTWTNVEVYSDGSRYFASTQKRSGYTEVSTTFTDGSVATDGSGNYYVSLQDNNVNHALTDTTWWAPIQPYLSVGPNGFVDGDVGRSVRLFSQPANWGATTTYAAGDTVTFQDAYYTALVGSVNVPPGSDATTWGVASNVALWAWGIITAVNSTTNISVSLQADLLLDTDITTWQLGVYANSTTWPACGTFHEGRFWLGGAVKNRFDASRSAGNTYDFSPTALDGTVADDNGISYILAAPQQNQLLWLLPGDGGIIMGTAQGEWLVQSSANNDPITPTSIQAHNNTKWGSANVEPRRTGQTIAFVQRYGKKVMEYLSDLFSGKLAAKNLSERAKHLTSPGIVRLAYQQELVPIVWGLTQDNQLVGTTYKRESMMVNQPPEFNAWHRHDLGSGFNVIDLVEGPSPNGLLDSVTIITQDPATGVCRVESITELFDETSTIDQAWFVDDGTIPCGGAYGTVNGVNGITLSGLAQLDGFTVSVFLAGLDCGDFTVEGGQVFVPMQSDPDKLLTLALLQAMNATGFEYPVSVEYTNPLTNTQTFMAFPPISDTYLSHFTYLNYGAQSIPDWKRDRVTFMLSGEGPYTGFIQYKISTGAFIQYVKVDGVFGGHAPQYYDTTVDYPGSPVVQNNNSYFIATVSGSYNSPPDLDGIGDWIPLGMGNTAPHVAAWVIGTSYNAGDWVSYTDGNVYTSRVNSNVGNAPSSSPSDWEYLIPIPTQWDQHTTYGAVTAIAGSNDGVYYTMQDVPPGTGGPTSFAGNNNNPYYTTHGSIWGPIIQAVGMGLDYNGDLYMYEGAVGYSFVKISGETLKIVGRMTAAPGVTVPQPAAGIVPIRVLNNEGNPEADYILETVNDTPLGTANPAAVLINVNSMLVTETATFSFDEGDGPIACSGGNGIGLSKAYVLTRPVSGGASVTPIGLYEINVLSTQPQEFKFILPPSFWADPNSGIYGDAQPTGGVKRKAGTIAPTDIDPTWTFFSEFTGIVYDPLDGNIMTFASTQNASDWNSGTVYEQDATLRSYATGSDGNVYHAKQTGTAPDPVTDGGTHWTLIGPIATQFNYMVKLTADCAQVLWTVPVDQAPTTDLSLQFINISNGEYVFLEEYGSGQYQVKRVNTLTGTYDIQFPTQQGINNLGGSQTYNGVTGDIIIYSQYDSTQTSPTPAPTPVNPEGGTTPATFTGWGRWNIQPNAFDYTVPGVVGFTYTSQGQLLRPVAPQATGARNGPAFGKNRRNHRYAMSVANTQGISIGTTFANVRPALFKTLGGTAYKGNQLYTGEHSATVEDTYSYDGMLCWQVTRPLPATMTAFGGFIETEDR